MITKLDTPSADPRIASEREFQQFLRIEQRRAERSGRPLVVLTLRTTEPLEVAVASRSKELLLKLLPASVRETDLIGWSEVAGGFRILCTETGTNHGDAAGLAIVRRLQDLLATSLPFGDIRFIQFSFESYPQTSASSEGRVLNAERQAAFAR